MTKHNYPFESFNNQMESVKLAYGSISDINVKALQTLDTFKIEPTIYDSGIVESLKTFRSPFLELSDIYANITMPQLSNTLTLMNEMLQPYKRLTDTINSLYSANITKIYENLPIKVGISNIAVKFSEQLKISDLASAYSVVLPKLNDNVSVLSFMRDHVCQLDTMPELITKYADNIKDINLTEIPDFDISINDMEKLLNDENINLDNIRDLESLEREYRYHLKFIDLNYGLDQIFQHCHEAYYLADVLLSYKFKQQIYEHISTFIIDLIHDGSILVAIGMISFMITYLLRDNEIMQKFIRAIKSLNDDL